MSREEQIELLAELSAEIGARTKHLDPHDRGWEKAVINIRYSQVIVEGCLDLIYVNALTEVTKEYLERYADGRLV